MHTNYWILLQAAVLAVTDGRVLSRADAPSLSGEINVFTSSDCSEEAENTIKFGPDTETCTEEPSAATIKSFTFSISEIPKPPKGKEFFLLASISNGTCDDETGENPVEAVTLESFDGSKPTFESECLSANGAKIGSIYIRTGVYEAGKEVGTEKESGDSDTNEGTGTEKSQKEEDTEEKKPEKKEPEVEGDKKTEEKESDKEPDKDKEESGEKKPKEKVSGDEEPTEKDPEKGASGDKKSEEP